MVLTLFVGLGGQFPSKLKEAFREREGTCPRDT